jgi:hypothetical protein
MIRLIAALAVVTLAFAAGPVLANSNEPVTAVTSNAPPNQIQTFDRKHATERATPGPVLPPGRYEIFPRPHSSSGAPSVSAAGSDSLTPMLGSFGSKMPTKAERLDRSLRSTAQRLR